MIFLQLQQLDKAGNTALFWASHGGHTVCMTLLLQSLKTDLNVQVVYPTKFPKYLSIPNFYYNAKNKLGDTALHAAAWKGRTEAVNLLLSYGAKVNISNNEGKTPLDLAHDPEIIDLLSRHLDRRLVDTCNDYLGSDNEQDSD